jgi:transcriptional regulator with XRE-family HTH domain
MIAFERAIAGELARRGPVSDETFRWIRKAAGLERGELAQILGVTPETIAGWEGERRPIDRAAWLLVASMVLDSIEGPRPVRARLKAPQRKVASPPELAIGLPAGGMTARVLTLIASSARCSESDLADALDVDESALQALLRDLATLGLVSPTPNAGTERSWAPLTEGPAALLRAAVEAGVDLDTPLPRATPGETAKSDPRLRAAGATWRLTSS